MVRIEQRTDMRVGIDAFSAPPPGRGGPTGILGFVWAVWPWMNWILPVFLVLHGFIGSVGGWESLMLLVGSPVIVPAFGLLGSLPRFILRRRGHRTAPGVIVPLLFLNWWGWVTFTLTMEGSGDNGALPSMLRMFVTAPLARDYEGTLFGGAVLTAVAAWVVVLVLACVLKPQPSQQTRTWSIVAWASAVAVPALLIGVIVLGVSLTPQQRDSAGLTVAEVAATPLQEQADRARENYTETQERAAAVRELIAPDGWTVSESGFTGTPRACRIADAECYAFAAEFAAPSTSGASDLESIVEPLRAQGWDVEATSRLEATDAQGYTLRIEVVRDDIYVEVTSPHWWGYDYDIGEVIGDREPLDPARVYRFDEWPELGA